MRSFDSEIISVSWCWVIFIDFAKDRTSGFSDLESLPSDMDTKIISSRFRTLSENRPTGVIWWSPWATNVPALCKSDSVAPISWRIVSICLCLKWAKLPINCGNQSDICQIQNHIFLSHLLLSLLDYYFPASIQALSTNGFSFPWIFSIILPLSHAQSSTWSCLSHALNNFRFFLLIIPCSG